MTHARSHKRLPFEPLERLVFAGSAPRDRWVDTDGGTQERGRSAIIASCLGVTANEVRRWRRNGLTNVRADVLAIRAGLHPLNVWSEALFTGYSGADLPRSLGSR